MLWRRGILLAILGIGVFLGMGLVVTQRETDRATRAISIARTARFGPARIRLEQILKKDIPEALRHWTAPKPHLWADTIEVELHVNTTSVYVFTVHLEGKKVDPISSNARGLIARARAVPRPGS